MQDYGRENDQQRDCAGANCIHASIPESHNKIPNHQQEEGYVQFQAYAKHAEQVD